MQVTHQLNEIIAQRYQITNIIGEGGIGVTYEAIDLQTTEKVALKVLSLNELDDWKHIELFEREAKVLASLSHPAIPRYLDYFIEDSQQNRAFYIVRELAPGESLAKLIEAGWRTTEEELINIIEQILEILAYLHGFIPPVIHRDIKPQNIILSEDGNIFLVDFGAVQNTYCNTSRSQNTVVGTYGYMAPERFQGQAFPASDLYSLGATILFLLTHNSPSELPQNNFKIDFRSQVQISRDLAVWLEKILEPNYKHRFNSAIEATIALKNRHFIRIDKLLRNFLQAKINIGMGSAIIATILAVFSGMAVFNSSQPKATNYDFATLCQSGELTKLYLRNGGDPNFTSEQSASESSLLFCFLLQKDFGTLELLIDRGADLETKNSNGDTALLSILSLDANKQTEDIQFANQTIAKLLISQGANINAKDNNGNTALMLSLTNRYHKIAKLLLEKHNNINLRGVPGENVPLMLAIERGYIDIAKILIAKEVDISLTNKQGKTALFTAIEQNERELIQLLIDRGANLNHRDNFGRNILFAAVNKGDLELVEMLVERGVNIDTKDRNNRSILFEAISRGNRSGIVEFLIDRGLNVNAKDDRKNTPLLIAVFNKNIDLATINLLLEKGAKVNAVNDNQMTPLLTAVSTNYRDNIQWEIVQKLIARGANVRIRNGVNSIIPLFMAAASDKPKIIELMLDKGASVKTRDENGSNVLLYAINRNYRLSPSTLKLLIDRGADVNATNKENLTPLILLVSKSDRYNSRNIDNLKINIELLIENGADINATDSQGRTPLLIAQYLGNQEIISLLKNYGAKFQQ